MQVKQLSWDGSAVQVCSLGGAASASLVAALPDRLILLRNPASGSSIMSDRRVSVLELLLHGWASLAAMGVLPGKLTLPKPPCAIFQYSSTCGQQDAMV